MQSRRVCDGGSWPDNNTRAADLSPNRSAIFFSFARHGYKNSVGVSGKKCLSGFIACIFLSRFNPIQLVSNKKGGKQFFPPRRNFHTFFNPPVGCKHHPGRRTSQCPLRSSGVSHPPGPRCPGTRLPPPSSHTVSNDTTLNAHMLPPPAKNLKPFPPRIR